MAYPTQHASIPERRQRGGKSIDWTIGDAGSTGKATKLTLNIMQGVVTKMSDGERGNATKNIISRSGGGKAGVVCTIVWMYY